MSVKVIKQKSFDVVGIVKSTFHPGTDISISYPNYGRVTGFMLAAIELMSPMLKPVDPKKAKGTFLWFRNGTPIYRFTKTTPSIELEKFNNFYGNFKKGTTFQEFFNFAKDAGQYLSYSNEDRANLGPNYRLIYQSASGSTKCPRYYIPKYNDEASIKFLEAIVEISNRIKKCIIQIDKSDRDSISLSIIFESILGLVRKSNPRAVIPKEVNDIFEATYGALQENLDEVYASYILTGSELGMFIKLVQGLITSLQERDGEKLVGVDNNKDEALFKELVKILAQIKEAVMKELSTNERLDLSDERMAELRNTISAINLISEDPESAIRDIIGTGL